MPATPQRIVQVSDIHLFGDPTKSLLGVNTDESFLAVIELLKTEKPNMVLLTGDLTQDSSEAAYLRVAERLQFIDAPIYCVPGNHDDNRIMDKIYPFHKISKLKQIIMDNWQFILLDSHIPNSVEGFLDQSQFDFLEKCLKSHPKHHAIIVFHHHPIPSGSEWLDRLGVQNSDLFWEFVNRYPRVNAVLFGHVHQEHAGKKKGVKYYSAPATCIQFKKNSAQFALEKLSPGYRWLDLYPNGVIETGVNRTAEYVGVFDENAKGY